MADYPDTLSPDYVRSLFDRLQDGTLTLQQCYELKRWVETVYLGPSPSLADRRFLALMYLNTINNRIIDLQNPVSSPPARGSLPGADAIDRESRP